ncbi:MAG: hypothetical protein LBB45_01140 [Methanobrevibacter sp.]|nr:hypothetical protein [Candidatus Methanovirga basalitermitum]
MDGKSRVFDVVNDNVAVCGLTVLEEIINSCIVESKVEFNLCNNVSMYE